MEKRERHTSTMEPAVINRRLGELLDLGWQPSPFLVRRLEKLSSGYRTYCRSVSPIWAPGAIITSEMRNQAETWLPAEEITSLLLVVSRHLCRFPPQTIPLLSPLPLSWPDLLARLPYPLQQPDPSRLLSPLLADHSCPIPLLFALFIPPRFGGGLGRYPGQMAVIKGWLADAAEADRPVRILDAACGSGEGTWEFALAARAAGIPPDRLTIHGSSLGELELMAGAHLFFPHDPQHQERMRQATAPLSVEGYSGRLRFFRDDLLSPDRVDAPYDLILCNGTIGGPFIHQPRQLDAALEGLTDRLAAEGVLCITDRFHGGWEKKASKEGIADALRRQGLTVQWGDDGVVAVKGPAAATTRPAG